MSRWSQGAQEIEQLLARRHLERVRGARGALRRRRNELEYPAFPGEHVEIDEVTAAITTAQNLFDAAHRLIGHLALFT